MIDRLRKPIFIAAAGVMALVVLIELAVPGIVQGLFGDVETPGLAISYLAIVDGMLLYSIVLMAIQIVAPRNGIGRAQGAVTLVVSILGLIGSVLLAITAFSLVILTVTLLVAVPFGTIAYMAGWGRFAVSSAAVSLSLIMLLKFGFCGLLLAAHPGFLKNKGIVILTAVSLGLTWVTAFLHALPPRFLVSIVDGVLAVVIAVIGAVWLLCLAVGSILAMIASARTARLG